MIRAVGGRYTRGAKNGLDAYRIPVRLTDSGDSPQTTETTLVLNLYSDNDNPHRAGTKSITVYNWKVQTPDPICILFSVSTTADRVLSWLERCEPRSIGLCCTLLGSWSLPKKEKASSRQNIGRVHVECHTNLNYCRERTGTWILVLCSSRILTSSSKTAKHTTGLGSTKDSSECLNKTLLGGGLRATWTDQTLRNPDFFMRVVPNMLCLSPFLEFLHCGINSTSPRLHCSRLSLLVAVDSLWRSAPEAARVQNCLFVLQIARRRANPDVADCKPWGAQPQGIGSRRQEQRRLDGAGQRRARRAGRARQLGLAHRARYVAMCGSNSEHRRVVFV